MGQLWLSTYGSWLGKCLSFVTVKLGLNPIIYSVCSWSSLVLDLGNLPIKLGLPMFLNLRRYSNLFMPVIMSILFHSIFGSFPIFYESRFIHNLDLIAIIRTVGIRFGHNVKCTKNIVINLEFGINWEHELWHVHRNTNWINLTWIIGCVIWI